MRRAALASVGQAFSYPVDRCSALLDADLLARLGYDPDRQIFAPAAADPVFGFTECKTDACDQLGRMSRGLCWRCDQLWRNAPPGTDFVSFCATAPSRARQTRANALCRVCCTPGHERPVHAHGLCAGCENTMSLRGQSADDYVAGDAQYPPAAPRRSFGRCAVGSCHRYAWRARPNLCAPHHGGWRTAGRPSGQAMANWCARQRSIDRDPRVVVLAGLGEQVRLELLFGVQHAAEAGRRTRTTDLHTAVDIVRRQGVRSLFELSTAEITPGTQSLRFLTLTVDQLRLAMSTPAAEAVKDDWDLRVFGHIPGLLRFSSISQGWLRETAKGWAAERITTVETPRVLQANLRALIALSQSLRRNRADGGDQAATLTRSDLVAFANDLSHLEAGAELARSTRRAWVGQVGRFLHEARAMGLSRPGGPMCGLPEDVVMRPDDRIRPTCRDEEGRALPQSVVDQLLDPAALAALEAAHGVDARVMFVLQASVGRRTGELCALRADCLAYDEITDEAGRLRAAPVLVHDMPKVNVRGYRLPIDGETAALIAEQQKRVRGRYPDTPVAELALFPAVLQNPRGTKPYRVSRWCGQLREWIDRLPQLTGPTGENYDRTGTSPYSLRHTYAQRHADAGTPVEVLATLMGHTRLTTTQVYYRVTGQRKRAAVDLLAALQVDRDGRLSRPLVERLLDTETAREAIGQVAVPFGICTEPTNVKAHGGSCPFRHQCFGCTHFRSDPSFLPELRAHLTRLLADQERLRAAVPELAEWARSPAAPSAAEIAALRGIIGRCEALVADLAEEDRRAVEGAVMLLRRIRAQLDTSVPVQFLGVVAQPAPHVFPSVERERSARDSR